MTSGVETARLQLARLTSAKGDLDRPVSSPEWLLPKSIKLAGDHLCWGYSMDPVRRRTVRAGPGMFDKFRKLRDARSVLRFAERWGVLHICRHGLPAGHPPLEHRPGDGPYGACLALNVPNTLLTSFAPIEIWLHYARQVDAILRIATQLHNGAPKGSAEDWRIVYEWAGPVAVDANDGIEIDADGGAMWVTRPIEDVPWWDQGPETDRGMVANVVGEWLRLGQVGVSLKWWSGAPKLELGGGALFGALAVQLMLALGQVDALATCSECTRLYMPSRRPNPNRRQYCDECRALGVPLRDAQRSRRAGTAKPRKRDGS